MHVHGLNLKPLAKQTIVITGATSGIGLCTARHAAKAGAKVFLIARDEVGLRDLCDEIDASGRRAAFAVADVGDLEALETAARQAVEHFGGFDTWVNAAGVAIASPILETPRVEHERLFQTNYWGAVNACAVAVDHLKAKGGALIIVGSIASDIGTPVLGAYAASKHAVKGFVDSLRLELLAAKTPISLTLIKPSGIGTPLGEHAANHMAGGLKIPPPAYPPQSVAKAILHAAQHARREIVVGGVGALQILGAVITPRLADRVSSMVGPLLVDPKRPSTGQGNLFTPGVNGAERSRHEVVLPGSLYTGIDTHRRSVAILCCLGLAVLGVALAVRKDRHNLSTQVRRLTSGARL